MVDLDQQGGDYLFPASQTAYEIYVKAREACPKRDHLQHATRLVYEAQCGGCFVKRLCQRRRWGLHHGHENSWLPSKMVRLGRMLACRSSTTPSPGTTDPTKSNSGNMFAGLWPTP